MDALFQPFILSLDHFANNLIISGLFLLNIAQQFNHFALRLVPSLHQQLLRVFSFTDQLPRFPLQNLYNCCLFEENLLAFLVNLLLVTVLRLIKLNSFLRL